MQSGKERVRMRAPRKSEDAGMAEQAGEREEQSEVRLDSVRPHSCS